MNITQEQLAGSHKKIGELEGMPVMENYTKGGLHFVFAVKKNGSTRILGTGSHKAIARHIAQVENPECTITELSKSEDLPKWLVEKLAKEEAAIELTRALQQVELAIEGK